MFLPGLPSADAARRGGAQTYGMREGNFTDVSPGNPPFEFLISGLKPADIADHQEYVGLFGGADHRIAVFNVQRHWFFAEDVGARKRRVFTDAAVRVVGRDNQYGVRFLGGQHGAMILVGLRPGIQLRDKLRGGFRYHVADGDKPRARHRFYVSGVGATQPTASRERDF